MKTPESDQTQASRCLAPAEIMEAVSDSGVVKTSAPFSRLFVLGILAGVYMAYGWAYSTNKAA